MDGAPDRLWLIEGERFALRANAHLSDDKARREDGAPGRSVLLAGDGLHTTHLCGAPSEMRGSLHCGTDDETVRSFGRDDDVFAGLRESGSRFARMPTLATIRPVAKMGHPVLWHAKRNAGSP